MIFLQRLPHTPILQLVTVNKKFVGGGEKYRPGAKRVKIKNKKEMKKASCLLKEVPN